MEHGKLSRLKNGHAKIMKTQNNVQIETDETDITDFQIVHDTYIGDRTNWFDRTRTINNPIIFWTDGSVSKKGVGAGIYCQTLGIQELFKGNDHNSIMQMEVLAINQALLKVYLLGFENRNVVIHSDSQASIKALRSMKIKSKLVNGTRNIIKNLYRRNIQVTIAWVPSHSGFRGNDMADTLANLGALLQPPTITIPPPKMETPTNAWLEKECKNRLIEAQGLKISKITLHNRNKSKIKKACNLDRTRLRMLIGAITGHGATKSYLHKIGKNDNNNCRVCMSQPKTMIHLICDCLALIRQRCKYFFKSFIAPEDIGNLEIKNIISFCKNTIINDIFNNHIMEE